jgi:UDP-3-O-[3-hydroxymyristoyl] N-acetylglucosamine deacetylase
MRTLSFKQCTLSGSLHFEGIGVHNGQPVRMTLSPAAPNSGYLVARQSENGRQAGPVRVHCSNIASTALCTVVDLGNSLSVATTEHVMSALAGLGVDNAVISVDGPECPIIDGSAKPFADAILNMGLQTQPEERRFIKINRSVTVRNNDAFAVLEPYNGRAFDVEIDFDNDVIGRQRMIMDWTPAKFFEQVAPARTFGFAQDAKVLRQAGFALGSSLENSIAIGTDRVLNPEGLRFEDEFVRHKLLDAIGDLALARFPMYGRFRSYKGGHGLNALVMNSLFSNPQNYEIVRASELPLEFEALEDLPTGLHAQGYLRSVG